MKITSSRKDEVMREYQAWKDEYDANQKLIEEESDRFYQAERAVLDPIKKELEYTLSKFSTLNVQVTVETRWRGGIEVRIESNDWTRTDEVALSWNFNVSLDEDGNVVKETGSWSGLQATTPAQLKSLRQSVSALEYLNDIDWKEMLNKTLPDYEDYRTVKHMPTRDAEFRRRLIEAELNDLVGENTLIKVENFESSGFRSGPLWVRLIRETPSQYQVNIIHDYQLERYQSAEDVDAMYSQRVKKSNLKPMFENGELVTKDLR